MANAKPEFCYDWYGLSLATPFVCPELRSSARAPEVWVRLGPVGEPDAAWENVGIGFRAAPGRYLLEIPGIARYLLEDGRRITVEAMPATDEDALRLFLYNEIAAALFVQRGLLVLKASVVAREGKAYALAGATATGKSFSAAGLAGRGYSVVSDGVCAITPQGTVLSGLPFLMLWRKGLQELGYDAQGFRPVRPGMNKHYFPVLQASLDAPLPLASICLLSEHNQPVLAGAPLSGMQKFFALLEQDYLFCLTQAKGGQGNSRSLTLAMARSTPVWKMQFNMGTVRVSDHLDFLAAELARQPDSLKE